MLDFIPVFVCSNLELLSGCDGGWKRQRMMRGGGGCRVCRKRRMRCRWSSLWGQEGGDAAGAKQPLLLCCLLLLLVAADLCAVADPVVLLAGGRTVSTIARGVQVGKKLDAECRRCECRAEV
jgi:hypothetical protein